MSSRGECLQCQDKFYLDKSTEKCVELPTNKPIENCRYYADPATCAQCLPEFVIGEEGCEQSANPIKDCDAENKNGICMECKAGFILSISKVSCIASPGDDSCSGYSNIECSSCASGFILNLNHYLHEMYTAITPSYEADVINFLFNNENGIIDGKKHKVCQAVQLSNCQEFEGFNKCRICNTGYYLTDLKGCAPNPIDSIPNCEIYSSLTSCVVCEKGFYMKESNVCVEVPEVEKCLEYSDDPLKKKDCIECEEGFVLLSHNTCVEREHKTIENCAKLDKRSETCAECAIEHHPTNDRTKCLGYIANCEKYQTSNVLSDSHTCTACENGFYYDKVKNLCLEGTIKDCAKFENFNNACTLCDNQFYLDGTECKAHDLIPGCDRYHPTIKNVCMDCNYKTYLFENENKCTRVDNIDDCVIYKSQTKCRECKENFYVNDEGLCMSIPVNEHCRKRNGNKCGVCNADLVLEDGACKDPLDYIVNQCEMDNVDGTTSFDDSKCFKCKENTFPVDYSDSYVCVEGNYMMKLMDSEALIDHCLHYNKQADGEYACHKCDDGFYVDAGVCVQSCEDPDNATIYKQLLHVHNREGDKHNESFSINQINTCGPTLNNCKIAAPGINQEKPELISYECVECADGHISVINLEDKKTLIRDPNNPNSPFGFSPVSEAPALQCKDPNSNAIKIVGKTNDDGIVNNCDFYNQLGPVTGCMKCSHGFTGVVVNVVNACLIYDHNDYTCVKCKNGYYLATPWECKQVDEIEFCSSYDSTSNQTDCLECLDTHYLEDSSTCTQRSNSANVTNSSLVIDSDDVTCNNGFFKDDSAVPFDCISMGSNCTDGRIEGNAFICEECDNTVSYLNTNENRCVPGAQDNCAEYAAQANHCVVCDNGYYLNNISCVAHTANDSNCTTWDQAVRNKCTQCNNTHINFTVTKKCREVPVAIANCEVYESLTTCLKCQDNYRLENLKTRCLDIPAELNCKVSVPIDYNNDGIINYEDAAFADPENPQPPANPTGNNEYVFAYTCDVCKNNTVRHKTTSFLDSNDDTTIDIYDCYSELAYKLENCDTSNITGTETFGAVKCDACATGFRPVDYTGKYICIENTYFTNVQGISAEDFANCDEMTYNNGTNAYECRRCVYPYLLQPNNTCGLDVPGGNVGVFNLFSLDTGDVVRDQLDSSIITETGDFDDVVGCLIYTAKFDLSGYACVKCKTGRIAVIDYTAGPAMFNGINDTTKRPYLEISASAGIAMCLDPSETTDYIVVIKGDTNISTGIVDDCMYYNIVETVVDNGPPIVNTYHVGCSKCNVGKSGPVLNHTHTDTSLYGYIKSCADISNCVTTTDEKIWAQGLGLENGYANAFGGLTKYFSCYECSGDGEIPIVFLADDPTNHDTIGTGIHLSSYHLNNSGTTPNDPTGGGNLTELNAENAVRCEAVYNAARDTVAIDAGFGFGDATEFILNCALAFSRVNVAASASDNLSFTNVPFLAGTISATPALSMFCVACEPGYYPLYFTEDTPTDKPGFISQCLPIENCPTDKGTWLNSCETCIHYFDPYTKTIDFKKCVNNSTAGSNCYAAYDVGKCAICKKGYDKDSNENCVKDSVPFCEMPGQELNVKKTFGSYINFGPASTYFLEEKHEKGCQQCAAGYTLVKNDLDGGNNPEDPNFSRYFCSDYNVLPNDVRNVANCSKYAQTMAGIQDCVVCNASYILTETGVCIPEGNITSCALVVDENSKTCKTCIAGRVNVGGKCITQNTLFSGQCAEFGNSSLTNSAVCTSCNDSYMLDPTGTDCIAIDTGEYPSCVAVSEGQCSKCDRFSIKAVLEGGRTYCYPIKHATLDVLEFDPYCTAIDGTKFNNDFKLECTECVFGYILEDGNVDAPTHCGRFSNSPQPQCSNFAIGNNMSTTSLNCTECSNRNTHYLDVETGICESRTSISFCAVYYLTQDKCETCDENYLLSENKESCTPLPGIYPDGGPAPNGGYIQSCSEMNTCDARVFYEGLNSKLASIFSCHKCEHEDHIPVAVVRAGYPYDDIESLQAYAMDADTDYPYDYFEGDKANICVEPIRQSFNIATDNNWAFPTNCGAAILNANSIAIASNSAELSGVDTEAIAVVCVACKPGFKATAAILTGDTLVNHMVAACDAIANCESSKWFNYCSQCEPGYSYGYSMDRGVHYDECIAFETNSDCFAVDNTDTNNLKCKFCKKGTTMNKDGYCEAIQPPRCELEQFSFRTIYSRTNLATGLYLSSEGVGCLRCDDGFVGLYEGAKDTQVCTKSPYHSNDMVTETSNFIQNCMHYRVGKGSEIHCDQCKDTFVLTIDGKCVPNSSLQNCKISFNEDKCYKCEEEFVLIDRACVAGSIANCTAYRKHDQSPDQICIQCKEGFFLQNNECVAGEIKNCRIFGDKFTCNLCKEDFGLVRSKNGVNYCFPVIEDINCSVLDYEKLQSGKLSCQKCVSDDFIITNNPENFLRNTCMPFIPVENCIEYDKRQSISGSTFYCSKCDADFYLEGNECKERIVQPSECIDYPHDADICNMCEESYFLATDQKSCISYPDGISGCNIYRGKDSCDSCIANMYLDNGVCKFVPEDERIQNCLYYEDAATCSGCENNYIIVEHKCEVVQAKGCLTFESVSACKDCPEGMGLKEEEGLLNCVQKQVENCVKSGLREPYPCEQCKPGFYIDDEAKCAAVKEEIVGCEIYDGEDICRKCAAGTALSVDGKVCANNGDILPLLDFNCDDSKQREVPVCNTCKIGYTFINGVCSECTIQNESTGCAICDPENPELCLMCAPGHYQYDQKQCVKNGEKPIIEDDEVDVPGGDNDGGDNEPPIEESVAILGRMAVIAFLLAYLL